MRKLLYLLLLLPFAASSQTVGIKVAAPIIKNDPSDNTVTGYAHLMNGGYTSVPTTAGRDSIVTYFSKRLRDGMIVYVRADSTEYRWKASTTAWEAINHGGTWGSITGTLSAQTDLQAALNAKQTQFIHNVKDYGATGGGSVDDAPYIQAALDSVTSGTLYFPEGTYKIASALKITHSNVTIQGAGFASKIFLANGSNCDVLLIGDTVTAIENILIKDIQIDGNKSNQSATFPVGRGVLSKGTSSFKHNRVTLDHVYIHHALTHAIYHEYGDDWIVSNSFFDYNSDAAVELGFGSRFQILGNNDYRSKYSFLINGIVDSYDNVIANNVSLSAGMDQTEGNGIHVNDHVYRSIVANNTIDGSRDHGISLHGTIRNVIVEGNRIHNVSRGTDHTKSGIFIDSAPGLSFKNLIQNNYITGSSMKYGIEENAGGDSTIIQLNTIRDVAVPIYTSGVNTIVSAMDSVGNISARSFSSTQYNNFLGGNTLSRNSSSTGNYFQNLGSGNIVQYVNSGGVVGTIANDGGITAPSFIKTGGTSSQFLKANGTVDATGYAPLANPTFSGTVIGTAASFNSYSSGISSYDQPSAFRLNDDSGWAFGMSSDNSSNYWMQVLYNGAGSSTRGFRLYNTFTATYPFVVNGLGQASFENTVTATQFNNSSGNIIAQTITATDSTSAPSRKAVYDALALKVPYSGATNDLDLVTTNHGIYAEWSEIGGNHPNVFAGVFYNADASGKGLSVKGGDATHQTLQLLKYDNTAAANFYGDGHVDFEGAVKSTQFKLSALNTAPSSATDTGTTGEIRITNGFIYICVASNTWQRAALATW